MIVFNATGVARLDLAGQLDVGQLGARSPLLLFDAQRIPLGQIEVLLNDDVARAAENRVLLTDGDGCGRSRSRGVLGAVDETQRVAVVEVLEAVYLVDDGDRATRRSMINEASSKQRSCRGRGCGTTGLQASTRRGGAGRGSTNRWSSAGRGPVNNRSHASEPMPVTTALPSAPGTRRSVADPTGRPGGRARRPLPFLDRGDEEDRRRRERRQHRLRLLQSHRFGLWRRGHAEVVVELALPRCSPASATIRSASGATEIRVTMSNDGSAQRPAETGWPPDTPVDDTLLRQFLHNQAEVCDVIAEGFAGDVARTPEVALAASRCVVPYLNEALLFRPLQGGDDGLLDEIEGFFAVSGAPAWVLLSAWPTRRWTGGWQLVGHPAFVVRSPGAACPRRLERCHGGGQRR